MLVPPLQNRNVHSSTFHRSAICTHPDGISTRLSYTVFVYSAVHAKAKDASKGSLSLHVCVYIYIHTYIHTYIAFDRGTLVLMWI